MTTYNPEQQALIDAPLDSKVVGLAIAGSGKSTTMLGRTQRILKEYATGRILLISFTRMSANDLREKLKQILSEDELRRVEVGTFHSIIGKLIRQNAVEIGLQPNVSIIDENSTITMYRSIVENNADYLAIASDWFIDERHPKLIKRDFTKIANTVSTLVNTAYPHELETGEYSRDTKTRIWKTDTRRITDDNLDDIMSMLHSVFIESLRVSRETNTLTYDHILFLGYLMSKSGLLTNYSSRLVHVIVDEYQDTNALQDAFVRAIAPNKLTIVGDLDQSIYEFRGGRTKLMEDHADEGIVCNLTYNYRSYQPILDLGNNIIAYNETGKKYRKPMRAATRVDDGYGGITYVQSPKDAVESEFVINKIKYLIKQGVKPSEIAILVRSRMAITSINLALQKEKIVVNDTTKFADFMNSDVMVDTLNFIKIFTNPKDIFAFMSVLDRPKKGIGPKAMDTLIQKAEEHNMGIIEFLLSEYVSELTPGLHKKVQSFIDVYSEITKPDIQLDFPSMVNFLLEKTGYLEWINSLKNNETHLRNLQILDGVVSDFVEEYQQEHSSYSLYDIANAFTFEMSSTIKQQDAEGIVIATIHGAKGLEWDHVFILGMEQEGFPGKVTDDADLESERRLMYVAITRARKSLTVCQSIYRIASQDSLTASQFLTEADFGKPKYL